MRLDVYQESFCESGSENIRLLAPAGSGKTISLLHRANSVFHRKEGKARFLIVTFTRPATDELKQRLVNDATFKNLSARTDVLTLNAYGYRRIRQAHSEHKLISSQYQRDMTLQNSLRPIWLKSKFIRTAIENKKVQVSRKSMDLIDVMKSMGFDHTWNDDAALAQLTELENLGLLPIIQGPLDYISNCSDSEPDFERSFSMFWQFWKKACQSLLEQSLFTFEDQKYVAWLDNKDNLMAGKLPLGGARYTDILIDEFQDINPLDLSFIKSTADLNKASLVIVGDDDQAIYEWRGASFRFILNPKRYFGRNFETFILENNYRCPNNLVVHSQNLISQNRNREDKNVNPVNTATAEIRVEEFSKFDASVDYIGNLLKEYYEDAKADDTGGRRRIAIVSRKRAQLIPYQILLAGRNVPFCAAEDLQIFLSDAFEKLIQVVEIASAAKYPARTSQIISDIVDLCDLVKRYPLKKTEKKAVQSYLVSKRPQSYAHALDALGEYDGALKGDNANRTMSQAFADALRHLFKEQSVREFISTVSNSLKGLEKDYGKSEEDIFYTDPPFIFLEQFSGRYNDDFDRFIDDLKLAKEQLVQLPPDIDDTSQPHEIWNRTIHLMTALRAKGREFDTVVILDANENVWPNPNAKTDVQIEAERRLFYVAMTRAQRRLIITHSKSFGVDVGVASRFLDEAGLIEN